MARKSFDPKTKLWTGPHIPSIFNQQVSLGHLILTVFKTTPNHVAQINADTDKRTTCYEMRMRMVRIARQLTKLGYKKGDIVAVMASNSEHVASLAFACFTLGLPINFLSPTFNKADIDHMLGITRPKLIFCDADVLHLMKGAEIDLNLSSPIFTFLEKVDGYGFVEDLLIEAGNEDDYCAPDLGDVSKLPAVIMCSSGTTGLSKGVALSHSMISEKFSPYWVLPDGQVDIIFNFATCYWITGLMFLITAPLYGQTRVFTRRPTSPKLFIEIVEKYKVTTLLTAPYFLAALESYEKIRPLPSIRHYLCGGSFVSKSLSEGSKKFLPNGNVRVVYGCTEIAGLGTTCWPEIKHGTAGKILTDDGNLAGPMEKGEICIKTKYPCLGYYKNPEQSKENFKEGWFHTGDIGYFDNDEFLYVVDRKKDIMKYQGFHISPTEIEDIINEMKLVVSSCVVGVQDEIGNDIVCAFVQRKNDSLQEEDVLDYVHDRVIDCKRIRGGVFFTDEFPLTSSGKILRRKLKERAEIKLVK